MQKLNHINGVIKLLEYFETLESYILVLERMVPNIKCLNDCSCGCEKTMTTTSQIQDVWDFITNHGPLNEDLTRKIFSQVVQTIQEVTKAGVVHRDIKDENILIDTQNHQIKIIDLDLELLLQRMRKLIKTIFMQPRLSSIIMGLEFVLHLNILQKDVIKQMA